MNKITNWVKSNKLSLNIKKSNYMLFKPRQRREILDSPIIINNSPTKKVAETLFLGVVIDEHVTWKPHIAHVASKAIGVLYKSSFFLIKSSLHFLYHSLVYPYFYYCILVWGSTYPSNLNRLITLQKRIVRIVNKES